uniref:Uncharacterized protein n=1 Tax=Arundo donax TaxID=35708 RepID=A0A0A9BS76_ARUDO
MITLSATTKFTCHPVSYFVMNRSNIFPFH